jgi:hypothetical protein
MLFLGSTPIGGPIVGWISQHFGARYGVGVGAVAALAAGAWGLARARRPARVPMREPEVAVSVAETARVRA